MPRLRALNGSVLPAELTKYSWADVSNFLNLPPSLTAWDDAGVVILPIPYEATTSWGTGTRYGPAAIIDASRYVEWYDEELDREPCELGICTLPEITLTMQGPRLAVAELRALYDDLLTVAGDRFIVGLGGEHSISSAPALAWVDRLEGDVSILQFDAHTDVRQSYHGTKWNHGCVTRRILEHTTEVVFVGIRAQTSEERQVVVDRKLTCVYAHEMRKSDWIDRVLNALKKNVYITFDVDFFDPSLIPATGAPEPGGGDWWDAMDLLAAVFRECNVVGADIVELSPRRGEEASAFTAAKLVYKMIGLLYQNGESIAKK